MLQSHKKTIVEILGRSPIHPFPARMAPGIALDALGGDKKRLRVLDPMAGSGTVLAVAHSKGHEAIGVDIDPLAVLLSSVWTRPLDGESVTATATEVLVDARKTFKTLRAAEAYPAGSNEETKKFVRYWFDAYARRQLVALAMHIGRVRDQATRDALWCGFSRLIITKSAGASLAMDLSHSRPHRKFAVAPVKPFNRFEKALEAVVANCPPLAKNSEPEAIVTRGDGRKLAVPAGSIDLVLTSPPYLNGIDYLRCSKFSLVWMGYNVDELRRIRGESVGTEAAAPEAIGASWVKELISDMRLSPALSTRDTGLLSTFVWDMDRALSEVARVLRPGGRAVYVVGDSMSRGTFISNSKIVAAVAKRHGLQQTSRQSRELPANRRYLPPPKAGASNATMDGRLRREVVVAFSKP